MPRIGAILATEENSILTTIIICVTEGFDVVEDV